MPSKLILQLQKQLETKVPPPTKIPTHSTSQKCLVCGVKKESDDTICINCQGKRKWDVNRLTVPLYIFSLLALSFSFLILVNNEEVLNSYEIDLEGRNQVGFLFLILGIISTMVISWERRRSLSVINTYKFILPLYAVIILPLLIVMLGIDPLSIIILLISIPTIIVGCIILFMFRKEIRSIGLLSLFFMGSGSFLTLIGILFSIKDLELTGLIWFLSGKHVAIFGIIILSFSSYFAFSKTSVITRSNSSVTFFSIAVIILVCLILLRNGTESEILDLLLVLPFMFLICSASSFMSEVVNDYRIQRWNSDMRESLKRAEDLEKRKKIFYALQQMDRAIRSNPVDGFGRDPEHANIIFRIGGDLDLEDFSFTASEYEISLNEKAKILSSQGKFTEAAREYQESIKRNPDFIETYQNLAMLLSSIPGKKKEAGKHLDYLLGSKGMYVQRWMRYGVPTRYVYWMADSFTLYKEMLYKKSDMLYRLSREGDIWAYYSLVRY
jgi:hypothetical protein